MLFLALLAVQRSPIIPIWESFQIACFIKAFTGLYFMVFILIEQVRPASYSQALK